MFCEVDSSCKEKNIIRALLLLLEGFGLDLGVDAVGAVGSLGAILGLGHLGDKLDEDKDKQGDNVAAVVPVAPEGRDLVGVEEDERAREVVDAHGDDKDAEDVVVLLHK